MRTLTVDQNNDIVMNMGRLGISRQLQAVIYACEHAVKAQLGEMILAQNRGVPNFQTIWSGARNIVQFEAALRRAILGVENVTGILRLDTRVSDNAVFYEVEIQSIYGTGVLGGL